MTALDLLIADLLLEHSIKMLRVEAHYQAAVLSLLKSLDKDIAAQLAGDRITDFSRRRLEKLLSEVRDTIIAGYGEIADTVPLSRIAGVESKLVSSVLARAVGARLVAALPTDEVLRALSGNSLILGGPVTDWWAKQGEDMAFRFANAVRQGVGQGETNAQIMARVLGTRGAEAGVTDLSKREAQTLVRTSIQNVSNATRLETFRNNEDILGGLRQVSTLDSRTSVTCIAYDGAQWSMDLEPLAPSRLPYNGGCPRHFNCRSTIVPIVKPLVEGLPSFMTSARASVDGPVSTSLSFSDWLDGKSKTFQNDLLGDGRADLWRSGKITLQQMLDQSGRPLSLEQLENKYK